ncbi:TonB-dependent receptor, partial [bacterium]|nr:TonB-dependent receptor [bacterium]
AGRIGWDESPRGWFMNAVSNKMQNEADQIGFMQDVGQYDWSHVHNTTVSAKINLVSQINKYNQIKAGIEFGYFHANRRGFQNSASSEYYAYDETTSTLFNFIVFKADPKQYDFYVQDKLEWEGMIINAGLRGTLWDPNTQGFDVNAANMFSSMWISDSQWGHTIGESNWYFQNQRTRSIKKKLLLQPRLGVSHPITESSKIFFNYGHFYQRPDFKYMYRVGSSFRAGGSAGGNGTGYLPTPDLPWPRTVSYEIGYSQSIYDQVLLQISGYYKDNTNEMYTDNGLGQGLTIQSFYGDVWYRTMANNRYRDIRGIEFRVERSFGRFVNFWANYNYMITSTGTTGFDYLYEDMTLQQEQYYSQGQTRVDPRPRFRLSFTLRTPVGFGPWGAILGVKPLAEWRANMIWDWRDGGEFVYDSSGSPSNWDYVQRVNTNMIDLYIQKRLAKGATFYINMQNVFNIKTFSAGGFYSRSLRYPFTNPTGNDKYGEYDAYHISTFDAGDEWDKWSPNRRSVYFGIRYQF